MLVGQEDRGKGINRRKDYIGVDALITGDTGVPLVTYHGDCVPLLILDPVNKGIGACHAGWKGTALKIGQKTIIEMMKNLNSKAKNILVGIGPSIGKCCYQISEDLLEVFNSAFRDTTSFIGTDRGDSYMLDLWEANRQALLEIGILDKNIIISDLCTSCNEKLFYSHRRDRGLTGRMASIIELK